MAHAAGTNTGAQTMLVIVRQAMQGDSSALLVTGLLLLSTGIPTYGIVTSRPSGVRARRLVAAIALSLAWVAAAASRSPDHGRRYQRVARICWNLVTGVQALRPSGDERAEGGWPGRRQRVGARPGLGAVVPRLPA